MQLQNQRIEPLNYLSTMCVHNAVNTQNIHTEYKKEEDDLAPIEVYFLSGGKARLNEIQKQQKNRRFFPFLDNKDKWMDCFSDTNGQI